MAQTQRSQAQKIRANLKHPIVDADGHFTEMLPLLLDYITQIGGRRMAEQYRNDHLVNPWWQMSPAERHDTRTVIPAGGTGGTRTNTLDRATALLPQMMNDRLDELGIDFSILYPSLGLYAITIPGIQHDEMRQVLCRALNTYVAEIYGPYSKRMTPAALIPMNNPDEAIAEIEHVINVLGLKVIGIGCDVQRPIAAMQRESPRLGAVATWRDTFGLDSEYNYDPVWEKCVELKVAVTGHGNTQALGHRTSISNYVYNHIGSFGAAGEGLCKSLFMSGVTKRFPNLNFAFLEGGVSWACSLLSDLVGHWEKRGAPALTHPEFSDSEQNELLEFIAQYGPAAARDRISEFNSGAGAMAGRVLDDFAACDIQTAEDIRDLFVPRFYFGCEADDPYNSLAFNQRLNPFGSRLGAMFGSDIGHWDVPNMNLVLPEAYELVEKELLTEHDFRDFMFGNCVRFCTQMNADFFVGTTVEDTARPESTGT